MKKVMKFVKGRREDDAQVKNVSNDSKKIPIEKTEDCSREDDFILRDKSITKLHKAVWNENCDKLKNIIKTHDIDITDKLDRTALYFAVLKNNCNIVSLLLENNANQNIPDIDGITPFLKSVQLGYKKCAAILLNHGADAKKTDKDLNSCLHYAVMSKNSNMLSFLIEHKVDCNLPNANGEYPLHIAVKTNEIQTTEILLRLDSEILHTKNSLGHSPMALAEQLNYTDIVSLLRKYDALGNKSTTNFPNKIDEWSDSPISSPCKRTLSKISKHFFSEETDITEEKSESDISVKCSENTSPQSGIIPPPCKPLRSLEYLQSGLNLENRPVHLLTLGTVRTRHISMTESEHSKNNTPHRYSYQGDFHLQGGGDSLNKIPDDKGENSANVSVKSKLFSKLECDSTLQSDWGSHESLPLDELSFRKDKSASSNTPKTSNSGSLRDKTTDSFLQKQFSILEDYEKKRFSVSYEIDLLTAKLDKIANNSESNLDDIDQLLEDNNRINAQLEKYAGQSDVLLSTIKSKSLPRNCEPFSSYHKGSFSLPRTLDSGKDPFKEMRSFGFNKPRSHFFSLKMLKGEKRTNFIDKLRNMFNKKSQIHLQDQTENGSWLYKEKTTVDLKSYTSTSEYSSSSVTNKTIRSNDLKALEEDRSIIDVSSANNEQNKVIEKKIMSLNNGNTLSRKSTMNRKIRKCDMCNTSICGDDCHLRKTSQKSVHSVVKKPDRLSEASKQNLLVKAFCEDCSQFVCQKISEAEENIINKEKIITLLREQVSILKDRNVRSINESQDIYLKYGTAKQESFCLRALCKKYEDELQKFRSGNNNSEDGQKIGNEVKKIKDDKEENDEHYEVQLSSTDVEDVTYENEDEVKDLPKSGTWRNIIQQEVTTVVNILKENSQTVVNSLEKQNKTLETLVHKLQNDLEISTKRQMELQQELNSKSNTLVETLSKAESRKIVCKNCGEILKKLQETNKHLQRELETVSTLYKDLKNDYEININRIESSECKNMKEDYKLLDSKLLKRMQKIKNIAIEKSEELKSEIENLDNSSATRRYINGIVDSLDSIESETLSSSNSTEIPVIINKCKNIMSDIEKLNQLNSNMEVKILEIQMNNSINYLDEQNKNLKDTVKEKSKIIDQFESKITKYTIKEELFKEAIEKHQTLKNELDCTVAQLKNVQSQLAHKDETVQNQTTQINELDQFVKDVNVKIKSLENIMSVLQEELYQEKQATSNLSQVNLKLKNTVHLTSKEKLQLKEEINNLKSSIVESQKLNNELNTELTRMKQINNELVLSAKASSSKLEQLEAINKELLKQTELNNNEKEKLLNDYKKEVEYLLRENNELKEQNEKEKQSNITLKQRMDSLQFYHNNEMTANDARFEELKAESEKVRLNFNENIDKLTDENTTLQSTINRICKENANLKDEMTDLKIEIKNLYDKLFSISNKSSEDKEKLMESLQEISKENMEMKTAVDVLSEILEENLSKNKNPPSYNKREVDVTHSCSKVITTILKRNILSPMSKQKRFREIQNLDNASFVSGENLYPLDKIKSKSLSNMDELLEYHFKDSNSGSQISKDEIRTNFSSNSEILRKTSSLDNLSQSSGKENTNMDCKGSETCKSNWNKHIEVIQKLRTELVHIIEKIDTQRTGSLEQISISTDLDKNRHTIYALQRQVSELQTKSAADSSKCHCLISELQGIKGDMVAKNEMNKEIYKLRQELYKERNERLHDSEIQKIQKETEVLTIQHNLKQEYLQNKHKLLSDLAVVQNVLLDVEKTILEKNENDLKIKKKFEELIKEVNDNKELRKKSTLYDISYNFTSASNSRGSLVDESLKSVCYHDTQSLPSSNTCDDKTHLKCRKLQSASCYKSKIPQCNKLKTNTTITNKQLKSDSVPNLSQMDDLN